MTKQEALKLVPGDAVVVVHSDLLSIRVETYPWITKESYSPGEVLSVKKVWGDGFIEIEGWRFAHPPVRFKKVENKKTEDKK